MMVIMIIIIMSSSPSSVLDGIIIYPRTYPDILAEQARKCRPFDRTE
jgi:hypothetical protein